MGLAKCLGGFHNTPSVLQAPFFPLGPRGFEREGMVTQTSPGEESKGCGLTVRQLLYRNCPLACPCPVVSSSPVSWGELLPIWAGRREFGWAVRAEEVQRCAFTPRLAPGSLRCVPVPSGGKRTTAFPWKTARCHKVKLLGGSGELSSSADC